jgi:hypothetical protein
MSIEENIELTALGATSCDRPPGAVLAQAPSSRQTAAMAGILMMAP